MDFEVSGDVLVLPAVLRKDSGIYQCRPLDVDEGAEVKGEVLLTVHCKSLCTNNTLMIIFGFTSKRRGLISIFF